MKIVILGAGQVGSSVAENLVSEANDITIVDINSEPAEETAGRFRPCGRYMDGRHPAVLEQAGAGRCGHDPCGDTDDETNIVACKLAATMFNIPTKNSHASLGRLPVHPEIFSPQNFSVVLCDLSRAGLTDYIANLLEFSRGIEVLGSPKVASKSGAEQHLRGPLSAMRSRICAATCPDRRSSRCDIPSGQSYHARG